MSIRLMTLVWDVEWPSQSQLLIALKLADHANDEGDHIWPARSRIAKMTQCSESTVKTALRMFRAAGLLRVLDEGGKGPGSTTSYAFNVRLLHALAAGQCRFKACDDGMALDWIDKGSEFDPFAEERGQPDPIRGQPDDAKGSKALTPNHQEPSPRIFSAPERACDESARAPFAKVQAAIEIRSGEACFESWLAHVIAAGKPDIAEAARAAGTMTVPSRWPKEGSAMPKVATPAALTAQSRRMTGEHSS